jgi:hypothetical protein
MPDYSKGKIYRLDCGDLVYVGSTTQSLATRKGKHHTQYKRGTLVEKSRLLYEFAETNGLELTKDITIELLELCSCSSKEELNRCEGKWIRKFKEEYGDRCINKRIEGRTDKEYRMENRDTILQRKKEYREQNKDKIAQYNQEQITCECGCLLTRGTLIRHKKTAKHIELMANLAELRGTRIPEVLGGSAS